MKKLITFLAVVLIIANVFAQVPQRMSYQAVIRNSSSLLVTSTTIGMKISILQGSSTGTPVYVETKSATTNSNGLVSIEIGSGTVVQGSFTTINWASGSYFVKTEIDPNGGTNYSITGTSQLLSVPYALYASKTGDSPLWLKNQNDIYYSVGNVGIGIASPSTKLHIDGDIRLNSRGQKISFIDNNVFIERPIGTDGLMMQGYDIYIRSLITPIQLQSGTTINMMDLSGNTKMVVNSKTGNVGIGTTNPKSNFQIGNNWFFDSGTARSITYNAYSDGTNWIYESNKPVCGIGFNSSDLGSFEIFTAPTGIAGTIAPVSQKFLLTSNGNVGIGGLIPQRTLHVKSVMRLEPIPTAPSSPSKGDMYFDSTINKLRVYDGTIWQNCW